jgi:hypothetical protein
MKNTLALAMVLLGGMLVYGGYKDYSFSDTIRFFTGQKLQGSGMGRSTEQIHPLPKKPSAFTPSTPSTNPPPAGNK